MALERTWKSLQQQLVTSLQPTTTGDYKKMYKTWGKCRLLVGRPNFIRWSAQRDKVNLWNKECVFRYLGDDETKQAV